MRPTGLLVTAQAMNVDVRMKLGIDQDLGASAYSSTNGFAIAIVTIWTGGIWILQQAKVIIIVVLVVVVVLDVADDNIVVVIVQIAMVHMQSRIGKFAN